MEHHHVSLALYIGLQQQIDRPIRGCVIPLFCLDVASTQYLFKPLKLILLVRPIPMTRMTIVMPRRISTYVLYGYTIVVAQALAFIWLVPPCLEVAEINIYVGQKHQQRMH